MTTQSKHGNTYYKYVATSRKLQTNREEEEEEGWKKKMVSGSVLIASDFVLSLMWVWAGALTKVFVFSYLGMGPTTEATVLVYSISVAYMFLFAWVATFSGGAAYNPLTAISAAVVGGGLRLFLFTFLLRIPAQIAGSIIGVRIIKEIFPQVGHGARLKVDIHHGALVEGFLTFMIVIINMGLKKTNPKSFVMKTWMSTICKMSLHILGSDLTGGVMNPASALGWAYARGDHISREHLFVYWVAPVHSAFLAVWTFRLFTEPRKSKIQQVEEQKPKSE